VLASAYWRSCLRRTAFVAVSCVLFASGLIVAALAAADQPSDDDVGVIEGDNIAINGPMRVESVAGQIKTVLRSGSDLRVKSGQARISLVEGGQISICGPAHLSVLKAGGSLTIALDGGVIHVRVDEKPALTVYTPQIEAKPVAIGGEPRDLLVGFASSGVMCVRTYRGAMRLEQQLSGQSVVVPQGGDVLITNGQIDALTTGAGHCTCELQIVKALPITAPRPLTATSDAGSSSPAPGETIPVTASSPANEPASAEKPAANDAPILHVDMPPLIYDASAKVQPEPDPRLMVFVRRVRVRSAVVFQGRVEDAPATTAAAAAPPPQPPAAPRPAAKPAPPPQPSVMDRVRSFVRGLWSHGS